MFSIIYNFLLLLVSFILIPKFIYHYFFLNKYKNFLSNKLGRPFKELKKNENPLVWIHAVSLGETKAIAPLAAKISQHYPNCDILVTSTTETGHKEAKASLPFAKYHLFLPFDFSWIINPIVKKLKPSLVILCESDYWYHFLNAAKENGAQIVVVNAKLSERSLNRFKISKFFSKAFFSPIDYFYTQSQRHEKRFLDLGIPKEKLKVMGNIKLDNLDAKLNEEELLHYKKKFQFSDQNQILVVGSTHSPEEKIFLEAFLYLKDEFNQLRMIIVPRHPERFHEVKKILESAPISFNVYSEIEKTKANTQVFLMDTMGQLKNCYQIANITFVGGSFTSHVGGHNILEPGAFGKPVIFGPFMHTQKDFVELIHEYNAGIQISKEELISTLRYLLKNPHQASMKGKKGKELTTEMQGATQRIFDHLVKHFHFS